jgi:lipoyl(octanoyl) transferase
MKEYSLDAKRLNGATGVWLEPENPPRARKICAMGVRASRWVTMHGFSLNINTDLKYFNYINPCGFTDKGVTSVSQEINSVVDAEKVKVLIKKHFEEVFDVNFINFKISL